MSTTSQHMDFTTIARPLLFNLPGLQSLGWAKYIVGSSVAVMIMSQVML